MCKVEFGDFEFTFLICDGLFDRSEMEEWFDDEDDIDLVTASWASIWGEAWSRFVGSRPSIILE